MPALLLDRTAPGATTCIVVGKLLDSLLPDLSAYRLILWATDDTSVRTPPSGAGSAQWQVFPIDRAAPKEFPALLEQFVRSDPRHLPSLYITDELSPSALDRYQQIITEIHAQLESAQRVRLTRQRDGFVWQRHILLNASAYLRRRLPASWAGALRGLPALVCGAGPSLDVSIGKLAQSAGDAVIFSADSALRALARQGVRADFAVSIDAAKVPEKCVPANLPPERVVLASVSPPGWQKALPVQTTFFLSSHQLTDDWFATFGAARTDLSVVESCGSTALELACFLGCDPIYLFGMDLAVDAANPTRRHQQHADPSLYLSSNYDPGAEFPRVPGNYVDTVPCFALEDWRQLDTRLAARVTPRVLNVNDRGARLRGTTLVHPHNFALAAQGEEKHARLARLPRDPRAADNPDALLTRLRAIGERCNKAVQALRHALDQQGPAGLAHAFRPLVLDPDGGRALGAFALKLMPYLVPPIEGDRALWSGLLTEFEELAALAQAARPPDQSS